MAFWQYLSHVEPVLSTKYVRAFEPVALALPPTRAGLPVAVLVAACAVAFPVPAAPVPTYGWQPELDQPSRVFRSVDYRTGAESVLTVPQVAVPTGWLVEDGGVLEAPRRVASYATGAEQPTFAQFRSTGWYPQIADSIHRYRVDVQPTGAETPLGVPFKSTGWFPSLQEPIRPVRVYVFATGAEGVLSLPVPVEIELAWARPLEEPVRVVRIGNGNIYTGAELVCVITTVEVVGDVVVSVGSDVSAVVARADDGIILVQKDVDAVTIT